MTEYYIWLLTVMGAANPRSLRLISRFGGAKEVYEELNPESGAETGFLKPHEARALKSGRATLDKARDLVRWCERRGVGIVTIDDDEYPYSLKHIYNPPIVLFYQGEPAVFSRENGDFGGVCVNVIGTRNPSEYSCRVAHYICSELAKIGITIVSGMAVGLDKCSMTAALNNGGRVAGVLACGIDVDYPRGSTEFRKTVADSGGIIVSELLPRDQTRPAYFQNRNRIMSGVSSGTLIIEAGEISGCHITAGHAICQNRDLFCVPPHDILDPRYSGVARYLRDGAIPVFSHIDIVNEYLSDVCERLADSRGTFRSAEPRDFDKQGDTVPEESSGFAVNTLARDENVKSKPKQSKKKKQASEPEQESQTSEPQTQESPTPEPSRPLFKTREPEQQPAPKIDLEQIPEEQARIVEELRKKKLSFDEIVKKKLCTAERAYELLLDMELDGLIERIAGDRYQAL